MTTPIAVLAALALFAAMAGGVRDGNVEADSGQAVGRSAHTLRIHGLAGDGIATPRSEPVATATATHEPTLPTPANRPTPVAEPTRQDAPVFGSVEGLICSYGWSCGDAVSVARCESNLDPDAYNPSGASGLFQVMPRWHNWRLGSGESLFDPSVNVRVAYEIWAGDGGSWAQWSCKP